MAGLALLAAACAPSLSTLQPAHVAAPGHVQVALGTDVAVSTGTIGDVIDVGRTLSKAAADGRALTNEEQLRIFDAGVTLAALPPLVAPHFAIAYVPVERFEANLRWAGEGFRLGGRYQILDRRIGDRVDLTAGLGVGRSVVEIPLADEIPLIDADDLTRMTVDVPVLFGLANQFGRIWGGPRFAYTRLATRLALELPNQAPVLASFTNHGFAYGAQAGAALGYRKVFLGFELTIVRWDGTARTDAIVGLAPTGRSVPIESVVVQPSFALFGEF